MKIEKFKDTVNKKMDCYAVFVSQDEALSIINSLANQISGNMSGKGRLESYTEKGEYFSIFVRKKE